MHKVEANCNSAFFYSPPSIQNGKSYLFSNPVDHFICNDEEILQESLERFEKLRKNGMYGYCLISYEAGNVQENKLQSCIPKHLEFPLFQFYFFEGKDVEIFSQPDIDYPNVKNILSGDKKFISDFKLNTDKSKYLSDISKIKNYISEGETYQVNYTVKGKFNLTGSISDLLLQLIFNQSADYTAFINSNEHYVLSVSPELFFYKSGRKVTTKPMKGTIKRGLTLDEDIKRHNQLNASVKDRAENVMIVDLLRNDLGKISETGSVKVNSLFDIEKYETVFQMTSEIESKLIQDDLSYVIKNIFPCGSITGAPKISTMKIISELEIENRNIYTGSIGLVTPDKEIFNVAIRTLLVDKSNNTGEIGIGSGIVWDSNPDDEYNETLLKGEFLTKPDKYFELFETILFEEGKYFLLEEHLSRLKNAAEYLTFQYDDEIVRFKLKNAAKKFANGKKYKVKLTLSKWGDVFIYSKLFSPQTDSVKIIISPHKINPTDKFRYFKTTNRKLYDEELKFYSSKGFSEVIYFNIYDELTEGSISNIFIRKEDIWYTPPVECGILEGCYGNFLLENDVQRKVKKLFLNDLTEADEIILTNSVRKEIPVDQIWLGNERIK